MTTGRNQLETDAPQRKAAAGFAVQLRGIRKEYRHQIAVEDIDLSVEAGEFVCLLGPSGCGKTTTLRMIAGFVEPTAGEIFIEGRLMNAVPSYGRNCGMVFQNYALFPHLSAFDNVAYGLSVRRVSKGEIERRVKDALRRVQMTGWEHHYPRQMSGGQQQRIALARALVIKPSVLLLDEPLSNLDARLRQVMREDIRALVKSVGITTIFVTHDQEESLTMADRIVVMNRGKIEQVGSASDIYERPQTAFVATFIGTTNLIEGVKVVEDAGDSVFILQTREGCRLRGRSTSSRAELGDAVAYSVRPERIRIRRPGDSGKFQGNALNQFNGVVMSRTYIGSTFRYRILVRDGPELLVDQQNRESNQIDVGEEASISWSPNDALVVAHGF